MITVGGVEIRRRVFCLLLAAVLSVCSFQSEVYGSGFSVFEHSVRGAGQGTAGASAGFGDGSSVVYNPAAMSRLGELTIHQGNHLLLSRARFSDRGSSNSLGASLGGGSGGQGFDPMYSPNIYYAGSPVPNFHMGLGLHAPYQVRTDWGRNWVGRYHAAETELLSFAVTPAASFRIGPYLSIGAGVPVVYADISQSNAVNFAASGGPGTPFPPQVGAPGTADGFFRGTGDGWAVGCSLGALLEAGPARFGVSYRSKLDFTLDGSARFEVPSSAVSPFGGSSLARSSARTNLTMPEEVRLDAVYSLSDRWEASVGAAWTRWSRLERLSTTFDMFPGETISELNWESTWRIAAGTAYDVLEELTLRAGLAYQESPVSGSDTATPRFPDQDSIRASFGATYRISQTVYLDAAYAHGFYREARSDALEESGARLRGRYRLSGDLLSLGLTYRL